MHQEYSNFNLIVHPLVKKDITVIRDVQTDCESFRAAISRVANIIAVKLSENLSLIEVEVKTPLEKTKGFKLAQEVVIVPVLRAGLGMVNGFLQVIPDAKVGHIGLERDEKTLKPVEYYYKTPGNLVEHEIILVDPMLATGGSASAVPTSAVSPKREADLAFTPSESEFESMSFCCSTQFVPS